MGQRGSGNLARHVYAGRFCTLVIQSANVAVELADSCREIRLQTEVGKIGRAISNGDATNTNSHRSAAALFLTGAGLLNEQATEVGGQVFVDNETDIGLLQRYLIDCQAVALIIDAAELKLLPFQQVALALRNWMRTSGSK